MTLTRGGWAVPCRITKNESGWQATVNGEKRQPHPDPTVAADVARLWHYGDIITRADYTWLHAVRTWAAQHQPAHPALRPDRRMDPMMLPILPVRQPC